MGGSNSRARNCFPRSREQPQLIAMNETRMVAFDDEVRPACCAAGCCAGMMLDSDTAERKRVLVTGGNAGIGLALCEKLAEDCHVYLCSRSAERGEAAVQSIREKNPEAKVELVVLDVASADSVTAAAASVDALLKADGSQLYAVVNNAGAGLSHGVDDSQVLNTNFYGVERVCDAFLPMLAADGRIVNVGSGAGPLYLGSRPVAEQKLMTNPALTREELEAYAQGTPDISGLPEPLQGIPGFGVYSHSKAVMMSYTAILAREHPALTIMSVHPGFIKTSMSEGLGATGTPLEGALPILHMLFENVEGHGWFYEEDMKRSALHIPRWPPAGKPEYDGALDFDKAEIQPASPKTGG